jgi:hypothetical protein
MPNGARQGPFDVLRDLLTTGVSVYPLAASASFGYWSELAASASSYYGDLLEGLMTALRNPGDGGAVAADLAMRLRRHLEQAGEITERAILEFNQRLEARLRKPMESAAATGGTGDEHIIGLLRSIVDVAMSEVWKLESPDARPDFHTLRQEVERLLGEIRRLEPGVVAAPPAASGTGSGPARS